MSFGEFENFGNYDRDSAYDVLAYLMDHIVKEIRHGFTLASEHELYGSLGEGRIMANIDIILTLSQHYKMIPFAVKLAEAQKWKQDYLETFARTRDEYDMSEEYYQGRKAVIEATFDSLIELLDESPT